MPIWPLDSSSGLPNTTEDFEDAAFWYSYVPRYRPLRQPMTTQSNNEFKKSRWDIGWRECHFVSKLRFMHIDSKQLNVFDTNATHYLLGQLEKSARLRNELVGAGQNRRWTVKFCKGWVGVGVGVWALLKIAGDTLMKLTYISTACEEKRNTCGIYHNQKCDLCRSFHQHDHHCLKLLPYTHTSLSSRINGSGDRSIYMYTYHAVTDYG